MKQILLCLFTCCITAVLFAQNNETPTPQWRPVYHFTPAKNWTNDPNGLLYINGVYNMYNQQNPFENKWGHMSWGHATSTDLVHWSHLPIAIPEKIDKDTTWIFSGSAVLDKNNTSGFCKTENCIVAIYTADQPNLHKESQFIAYSNDGGMTFTNYANNPVIDLQKKDFRDPNVFWYEPLKKWLMTVVLPTEYKARFYTSPNLKDWTLLSEFGPQGFTGGHWECPFLIQLPVEGTNQKKWVLFISAGGSRGSYMQYFVGNFDGKEFKNDNPADTILTVDYGDCFYAAIPWNNLPDNQKTFIGWMVPNPQPTCPWRGQMSIPRDLSLRQTADGIRLVQQPAKIIKNNLDKISGNKMFNLANVQLSSEATAIDKSNTIKGNAWWMTADLTVQPNTVAGFTIAQPQDNSSNLAAGTTITYDATNQQLIVDRSKAGGEINPKRLKDTIDVKSNNGKIRLEILLDKSSLEVFVNGGEKVLTTYIYPDEQADKITAFATDGNATITGLKIWDMSQVSNNQ